LTQFDRVINLKILLSKPDRTPGYRGSIDIQDLRIAFQVTKTLSSTTNTAQIRIWNLASNTRKELENLGDQFSLFAGYREGGGSQLIFLGNTTQLGHTWADPDYISSFNAIDGENQILNQVISYSFGAGTSVRSAIQIVAARLGLEIAYFAPTPDLVWNSGSANSDSARKVLDVLTGKLSLKWSVQNGFLIITDPNNGVPKPPIEINVNTGMIGIPEKFNDRKGYTYILAPKTGFKVRTLLNPFIIPTDIVRLQSAQAVVDGLFYVEKVTHVGDNFGAAFESILEVVAV